LDDDGSGTRLEIASLVTTKGEIHINLKLVNYDVGRAMFITKFLSLELFSLKRVTLQIQLD